MILVRSLGSVSVLMHLVLFLTVIATVCMEDYTEAATIVFLFSVADWLESSAAHKVCFCALKETNVFTSLCSSLFSSN